MTVKRYGMRELMSSEVAKNLPAPSMVETNNEIYYSNLTHYFYLIQIAHLNIPFTVTLQVQGVITFGKDNCSIHFHVDSTFLFS